ncbi:TraB/GumN family protein [Dyella lutea]|uniref:TraB/GumN family protein n=1 Tax=Dyella lutea TaxID=2950441 RepID=A0ABT1F6Q1_9GAMM|nr:TraB/GumN family protein [Dyella lutea]MCP1373058.1 TraB/GumN family protein [Dyella lutea]
MPRMPVLLLSSLLVVTPLVAQELPAPPSTTDIPVLAPVTVSGVQPGPGLWKVSKDGHVLWLLGTTSTLPKNMQWRSEEVERIVAGSQEVIRAPRVKFKLDVGFFGRLFLLPSAFSARKNPDGKTLDQVLPAPLYARWTALKARYIGRDHGIERWRPIFAGMELYKKALKKSGLRSGGQIEDTVESLAKQHGVKIVDATYQLEIKDPRGAIKAFKAAGPEDTECFSRTLDSVEHDLPAMAERANAWSTGDIATLRRLPDSRFRNACADALTESGFARQLGISDLPARVDATWLATARQALGNDTQALAVLSMDQLLGPGSYLDALKAEGYAVQAPDGDDTAEPAPAASAVAPPQ